MAPCAAAPHAAVRGGPRQAGVHLRAQPASTAMSRETTGQRSASMASVRPAWRRAGCSLAPREARGGASPSPLLPLTQPPPRASQPLVGRAGRPDRACSRHRCIGNHSFGCFVFGGLPHIWIANGCRGIFACHAASSASPVTQQCGREGNNNEKLNVCPCEGEL